MKAETVKKRLSQKMKDPFTFSFAGNHSRIEVAREKFEEITADLLDQTVQVTKETLEELAEKVGDNSIDRILLVGGSSLMPMVKKESMQSSASSLRFTTRPSVLPKVLRCGRSKLGLTDWPSLSGMTLRRAKATRKRSTKFLKQKWKTWPFVTGSSTSGCQARPAAMCRRTRTVCWPGTRGWRSSFR